MIEGLLPATVTEATLGQITRARKHADIETKEAGIETQRQLL